MSPTPLTTWRSFSGMRASSPKPKLWSAKPWDYGGISSAWSIFRSPPPSTIRSEEHTSELQSPCNLVCGLLLEENMIRGRCGRDARVTGGVISCITWDVNEAALMRMMDANGNRAREVLRVIFFYARGGLKDLLFSPELHFSR